MAGRALAVEQLVLRFGMTDGRMCEASRWRSSSGVECRLSAGVGDEGEEAGGGGGPGGGPGASVLDA